jgi:hypothetical protein
LGTVEIRGGDAGGAWQPIGAEPLRWGEVNRLVGSQPVYRLAAASPASSGGTVAETIVENVTRLASPSVDASASQELVLFALHDPAKPWHAATDIGTALQPDGGAWSLDRIADDQAAEFSPRIARVDPSTFLGTWTRVSGDVSGATNPVQVVPRLEIVAAWFFPDLGFWSEPKQLTTNAVVDRDPLPVVFGATRGILWIQNEADAGIGDATIGDRLLFSKWTGGRWDTPQTLWSGPKGILSVAFVADAADEGHAVLAVDEDGNLDTKADRELYGLSTASGEWQAAVRVTTDGVEDAAPALVAPNGVPLCVWSTTASTNVALVYTPLSPWNPRPVHAQQTLASEAPTLDGVTLPGGAAVAYSVQMSEGMDIFASFYDATLDRWSLPRQLTHDEDAESALSLACDGTNLVVAYLKTLTVRTNLDLEISGQMQHLENIPQPGRTDLCLLRHALGNDLAVVPGSLILEPSNPAPGSNATIKVIIENRGDLPVQGVEVVFYDGNPASGGTPIGSAQVISGIMTGGATQEVSVSWTVPAGTNAHDTYVVVDPALTVDDRVRANNIVSALTVLPDLAIETCWNTEISRSTVALVARLLNSGATPAGPFKVSWRLGAADGEEIGRNSVGPLAAGQIYEVPYLWNTSGRYFTSRFVTVYAVADGSKVVQELDELNNAYPQSVRVVPSWIPRLLGLEMIDGGNAKLLFEATGGVPTDFVVQSADSLAKPIQWSEETSAVVTRTAPGRFEVQVPQRGSVRFYRILATP